ncbi:MAG: ABC transporter permease [Acidobacteria bacterium]|nr:ABC transporter permease [Acidobacteriota bacterium]MDA1234734.1 ABC transporter permease [Acidobacteriota bacterium]
MRRIRYWLERRSRQAALGEEMAVHIEEKTAELIEGGMGASAARAEARRRFGNVTLRREESREVWISRCWSDFWQDLRYAVRNVRRDPGFAAVAILSAALGIGACTTVFSIVNAAVLRPLPVDEPDRLMAISAAYPRRNAIGGSLAYTEVQALRELTQSWEGIAAYSALPLSAGIRANSGEVRQHKGLLATANYFNVVRPAFIVGGGFIGKEDDIVGAPGKIVLTHRTWVSRFGADKSAVGRTIRVNTRPMTIVGVTVPGFQGTELGFRADFFLPLSQIAELRGSFGDPARLASYDSQWLKGLGRMNRAAQLVQAQAEFAAVEQGLLERTSGQTEGREFYVERAGLMAPELRRTAMPAFVLLLATTLLVLLTACANVANLTLAKASARRREMATRLAIGSGRGRIIRQLVVESLLLSLTGGLLGVVLAVLANRYAADVRVPSPVSADLTLPIDSNVVLFAVAMSIAAALVSGLAPALRATRADLAQALRTDAGNSANLRRFGFRNSLAVAQVAIAAALVVCSGLFERSLGFLQTVDSGMDSEHVLLVEFDPVLNHYSHEETQRLLEQLLRDTESLPGVEVASMVDRMPLTFGGTNSSVALKPNAARGERTQAAIVTVGPRYFEAIGISLLSGLDFPSGGPNEAVVIVNQKLADELFLGQNAYGRSIFVGDRQVRVTGVAKNTKFAALQEIEARPILYRPILGEDLSKLGFAGPTLIVKTAGESGPTGEVILETLHAVDQELVVHLAGSMEAHVQKSLFFPRLASVLFGAAGLIGLLIASIGIYGVISFAVARRTREISIRIALGARQRQVMELVLRHGAILAIVGIVLGLVGGLAVARAADSLIYGVSTTDHVTFTAAPILLFAVALLATAIPARRAARIDPNRTLRAE